MQFMKHYLELLDIHNREIFIAAEDITVVGNAGAGQTTIICAGVNTGLVVKMTYPEIIKKMVEIKAFELVKFN